MRISLILRTTAGGMFAALLVSAGCASSGAVPKPFPTPAVTSPARVPLPASAVVPTAMKYRGIRYRSGGNDPSGFDCSGFTQYVFARHGIGLPRNVREQFQTGVEVESHDIAGGDLLFFTTTAPGASHVGIALDAEQFVHAPSSRGVVRVERFTSQYWRRRFLGARRPAGPDDRGRQVTP